MVQEALFGQKGENAHRKTLKHVFGKDYKQQE